jgi:hypothetical protein
MEQGCVIQPRRQVRQLRTASTAGYDSTESMLSFLKVEQKYTIKWSFSLFLMVNSITYLQSAAKNGIACGILNQHSQHILDLVHRSSTLDTLQQSIFE